MAVELHRAGGFEVEGLDGYRANMAFMHAMQSGHTSFESAMLRILNMLGEEKPTGESWHRDLIRRISRRLPDRPAILDEATAAAAEETRAFRNLATRSYDTFAVERADPAVAAAGILADKVEAVVRDFRLRIDPPEEDGGGDGSGGGMSGGPV
ncbi:hypothetical protein LAZ40_06655 [Cereibacter sphaeroides]|uniref:ribonuclease toxin HepT-like protein n=1 Tax=Cereibacter sphaeroides TaxID=1063 RepID=UPI001F2C3963|nr:hypothetical protein [Cereibacter sphaeroides]MCE6958726.1 hypothetical protein [Cereibacter sphaeroides]MCE6973400.1 hypothetical protein [Cereibacter sphaeroides]